MWSSRSVPTLTGLYPTLTKFSVAAAAGASSRQGRSAPRGSRTCYPRSSTCSIYPTLLGGPTHSPRAAVLSVVHRSARAPTAADGQHTSLLPCGGHAPPHPPWARISSWHGRHAQLPLRFSSRASNACSGPRTVSVCRWAASRPRNAPAARPRATQGVQPQQPRGTALRDGHFAPQRRPRPRRPARRCRCC